MSQVINKARQNIINKINKALGSRIAQQSDLVLPPDSSLGDFAFPCFALSKQLKSSPTVIAKALSEKIKPCSTVKSIQAVGPYLNFTLQPKKLGQILNDINDDYGQSKLGRKRKIMVEFTQANTHKAFHIGHLRNIITGESLCRILENAGYQVIRVNYQGDIGPHVAKCLWGILQNPTDFESVAKSKDINKKVSFLGKVYAQASAAFESSESAKAEIMSLNKDIYQNKQKIRGVYKITRQWSLRYLDKIYKRLNTKFDRLYFESEVFADGKKIVMRGLKKDIFQLSENAIIFNGAGHGLHDRVFITSEGNTTYEAKEMALANLQFREFHPDLIMHVVGREQTEYFKVVIKALEYILPKSKGKEKHLDYGWVSLKGGKMSSRLGKVVLGEDLLDAVKSEIVNIMHTENKAKHKDTTAEKIAVSAVKFSFLKAGINKDIVFNLQESVSLSGNSGPYILYTYARINSILKKSRMKNMMRDNMFDNSINSQETQLLLKLALFPEIAEEAATNYDPSVIAKYVFELCKSFNDYYHTTSILKSDAKNKAFRLHLITAINLTIQKSTHLLGFTVVDKM